jgi:hypothetical protein
MSIPNYIAADYRITATTVIEPTTAGYDELAWALHLDRLPAEGVGLAWLEAPLDGAIYLGTPDQISRHQAAGPSAVLDINQGRIYRGWPSCKGWERYTPTSNWNVGGDGIVAELDGGTIVIYEYRSTTELVVTWHCTICHDREMPFVNTGPDVRRGIAKDAARHLKSGHRPIDPAMERAVAAAASARQDVAAEGLFAAGCRRGGECGRIDALRPLVKPPR